MHKKTLLIGYGNVDREDDGVAWHILCDLARYFYGSAPETIEDEFPGSNDDSLTLLYTLQLTPELAEEIAKFERVGFIDTHVGTIPDDIQMVSITPYYQPSPMTHHMTPQTCLVLADTIYKKAPEAILISVRGYEFGFSQELSMQTQALAKRAVLLILNWLNS